MSDETADFVAGLLVLLFVFGMFALMCLAIMVLWNWLVPVVFGLPKIGFLQAVVMRLLIWLLTAMKIEVKKGEAK